MSIATKRLSGVFAPITTPFETAEEIDTKSLEENLARYEQTELAGYLALGSNGENRSLTEEEKLHVLQRVCCGSTKTVIAGIIYEAQKTALRFIDQAAEAGAHFVLVQSPGYFKKMITEPLLMRYFTAVADHSPLPVLLYNAPGFNGITLRYELLAELSEHSNIVGMKDSSPNGMERSTELERDDFHVMAGSVSTLFPGMLRGSPGGTVSLANYLPDMAVELWNYGNSRDEERGRPLHERIVAMNKAISGSHGIAGVKAAMDLTGYSGGAPRLPLLPLNPGSVEQLKQTLLREGVL